MTPESECQDFAITVTAKSNLHHCIDCLQIQIMVSCMTRTCTADAKKSATAGFLAFAMEKQDTKSGLFL
jgi:hypothetical protein